MAAPSPADSVVGRLRTAGCVFAEEEAQLLRSAAATAAELEQMLARRITGEPIEHIVGFVEFCGIRLAVGPGVFVPRRRTELLVRQALDPVRRAGAGAVVVDLCCGSGAVGAVLASRAGPLHLHAVDIDPAAVGCARRNLAATGRVYEGDLFEPLPESLRGRVDVLVANAPYVPTEEIAWMPAEARLHEPRAALDGGGDGLDVLRRVVEQAPGWLAPEGRLLLETSRRQAPVLSELCTDNGLDPQIVVAEALDATAVNACLRRAGG